MDYWYTYILLILINNTKFILHWNVNTIKVALLQRVISSRQPNDNHPKLLDDTLN